MFRVLSFKNPFGVFERLLGDALCVSSVGGVWRLCVLRPLTTNSTSRATRRKGGGSFIEHKRRETTLWKAMTMRFSAPIFSKIGSLRERTTSRWCASNDVCLSAHREEEDQEDQEEETTRIIATREKSMMRTRTRTKRAPLPSKRTFFCAFAINL